MGFHHVSQAGLELLTSGDPPTSTSQSARITGAQPTVVIFQSDIIGWIAEEIEDWIDRKI